MISSKYVKHPVSHFMVITHEILPEIYIAMFLTNYILHVTLIAIFVILWVLDYYSYVTLLMLIMQC